MDIKDRIIKKQDELIIWLVKYTKPQSLRYDKFCNEIKVFKAQLKKQMKKENEIIQALSGKKIEDVKTITSTDFAITKATDEEIKEWLKTRSDILKNGCEYCYYKTTPFFICKEFRDKLQNK